MFLELICYSNFAEWLRRAAQSPQGKDTCGRNTWGRNTCGSTARAPGKDKGEKTKTTKYGKVKNYLLQLK